MEIDPEITINTIPINKIVGTSLANLKNLDEYLLLFSLNFLRQINKKK